MFKNLKYVSRDIKCLSESENVEINSIRLMIKPDWKNVEMTLNYYITASIKDYYDSCAGIFKDIDNIVLKYSLRQDISLVELMKCDCSIIKEYFDCDNVLIGYANYDMDYDEKLSDELYEILQSTWEAIYCAIHDC